MSQKNQLKKEIIDAACHLRSTNQTIPSSTIELMKTAALEKVEYIPAYEKGKFYYISKNGWFYRPNSAGYTERRTDAGVYSEKEAKEHAKPIPITIEWLKSLGFQRTLGGQFTYPLPVLNLWSSDNEKTWHVGFWQGKGYKYVHELQNLLLGLEGFMLVSRDLTELGK